MPHLVRTFKVVEIPPEVLQLVQQYKLLYSAAEIAAMLDESAVPGEWETGAYEWVNLVNDKRYVGGAYTSFKDRKKTHEASLRANKHKNVHFQAAWDKYGERNFIFRLLERCPPDKESIRECEQRWLDDRFQVPEMVYNVERIAGSSLGVKRRPETIEKMRKVATGVKQSEETIAKRVAKMKDQKRQGEALENIRKGAYKRPPVSDTERENRRQRANEQFKRMRSGRAILEDWQVVEIKSLLVDGIRVGTVAKLCSVSRTTVQKIKDGVYYRELIE